MVKKTRYAAVLLALLLALLASACGGSDDNKSDTTASDEPVKLKLLTLVTPTLTKEFWQEQTDRFTAKHPNVSVELVTPPDADMGKFLRQLLASHDLPDVAFSIAATPTTVPLLTRWDLQDEQVKQVLHPEAQTVDGSLYTLGVDVQPRNTIFYNMDALAKAGVTKLPRTEAEFEQTLAALKAGGQTPLCGAGEWVTGRMLMGFNHIFNDTPDWYQQRAAGDVKFDSPEWVEAATRFKRWGDEGYFSKGALGTTYVQASDNFRTGKCAMYQMGIWYNGDLKAKPAKFRVAIGAYPSHDGSVQLTGGIGSAAYAVFKGSKHLPESEQLARFLAFDPTTHQRLIETNGTFSNLSTARDIKWRFNPLELETQKLIEDADAFDADFIGQGDNVPADGIADAVNVSAQALLSGNGDPAGELKKLDALWDRNSR